MAEHDHVDCPPRRVAERQHAKRPRHLHLRALAETMLPIVNIRPRQAAGIGEATSPQHATASP
jgi:hypothetical protein